MKNEFNYKIKIKYDIISPKTFSTKIENKGEYD